MCSGARRPPPPTPSLPILVFRRPHPAALAPRATASSLFFCPSSSSAARVLLPPRPRPAPPTRHLIALGRCHPRLASLPPASAAYASPSRLRLRTAPPIPPFASPRLASFSLAGAADASPRRLVPASATHATPHPLALIHHNTITLSSTNSTPARGHPPPLSASALAGASLLCWIRGQRRPDSAPRRGPNRGSGPHGGTAAGAQCGLAPGGGGPRGGADLGHPT